MNIWVVGLKEV